MLTADKLIALLELEPLLVEGGHFRRTYRAAETLAGSALPARYPHAKSLASAIYYLLSGDECSALHRLLSDEIYHFYIGDPVELLLLYPGGESRLAILGPNVETGEHPQFVVPRGVWQGSRLRPGGRFALLGATMAPAWDESDFELGERDLLLQQYPDQAELIRALTADDE